MRRIETQQVFLLLKTYYHLSLYSLGTHIFGLGFGLLFGFFEQPHRLACTVYHVTFQRELSRPAPTLSPVHAHRLYTTACC
jgi:hypothetical protein